MNKNKILILTGPTATGKSSLSLKIAEKFNCEIINIDSMQVYKYFDIGTDKPDKSVLNKYIHHLLSYVDPCSHYDVKKYINDSEQIVKKIIDKGKIPLFVGGTGLYIKCMLFGLIDEDRDDNHFRYILKNYNFDYLYSKLKIIDYATYKKTNKNDKFRVVRALAYFYNTGKTISEQRNKHKFREAKYSYLKLAINFDREKLYKKINYRVDNMIKKGLIEETQSLLERGYEDTRPMNGIGYKEIKDYIKGKISKQKAIDLIKQNTRKYAKRQITWFKKEDDINWVKLDEENKIVEKIKYFLEN